MPFEAKLDENNRWFVLSKVIPWDNFAELYYKNFPSRRGAPTKDARMVLGVVIIKHMMKLDDIGVIEFIQENPCAHYFLGLKGFTQKPVFDPSLLVHIRKRIDLNVFESLTDELIRKGLKIKQAPAKESKDDDEDEPTPSGGTKNKGKLQLDATVADAQIKFPTDLDLLSDSRVKAEDLIDHLCKEMKITNKPRTYRKIARKEYLNVSKMKRKPDKVLRRGLRLQINYLKRDIRILNGLLDKVKDGRLPFDKHQSKYFFVIQHVLAQQEAMFKEKSNSCEDRIVSIHQPHVRPIVRGKAKAKVEFGAKINVSLQEGYARIDRFEWDAYNEGCDLPMQVERYKTLNGHYPELVQVDKIYLNRANRAWLKERNIRHTGEPLGRKPAKTVKSYYLRRKERREAAERNQIEGKFGQGKNGYDMNQIRAKLPSTSMSWIAAIIFIMNVIRYTRDFPGFILNWLYANVMRMREEIIFTFKPSQGFLGWV
ncbi:MAG: IS5 family transposase [Bacteroidales bacterium]|nr:IS5 family transposase [Bacteroidales bacterium]